MVLFIALIFYENNALAIKDDCTAIFAKKGITVAFPIIKKRTIWEWYKKPRPEYLWVAETGFYENGEFKGNGFGIGSIIGTMNLKENISQKGNINDLVRFSSKGAFLTKDSKHYSNTKRREKIQFETLVVAEVVDDEFILFITVDKEAVKMAKIGNPTHMKLTATLPDEEESYICFPAIETVK